MSAPKKVDFQRSWEFFKQIGSPKCIVAPMVNQSELAFRKLCRQYGAGLCFTPMLHSRLFASDPKYRKKELEPEAGGVEDRPLIVQFCANDAEILLEAAKLVQDKCDAVDINLGCPQGIARKGHYGSFLLNVEEFDLIAGMVRKLHDNLSIPVTCKIRLLPDPEDTMTLVKLLQDSGCAMLTVHGRTRDMIKERLGPNDFDMIRRIKEELSIPVIANGGIEHKADIEKCLEYTKCDGVMVSEGILANPRIFQSDLSTFEDTCKVAQEYIDYAKNGPMTQTKLRGHLFKILFPFIMQLPDVRKYLAGQDTEGMMQVVPLLRRRFDEELKKTTSGMRTEGGVVQTDEGTNTENSSVVSSLEKFPSWYARHQKPVVQRAKKPAPTPKDMQQEKQCPACQKTLPRTSYSVRGWKHAKGKCVVCSNSGGVVGNFKCLGCDYKAPVFDAVWNHLLSTRHFAPACAQENKEQNEEGVEDAQRVFVCVACGESCKGIKKFCRHVSRGHRGWVQRLCAASAKGTLTAADILALVKEDEDRKNSDDKEGQVKHNAKRPRTEVEVPAEIKQKQHKLSSS
jgi:tRNA-dihydrouridine synthase 1